MKLIIPVLFLSLSALAAKFEISSKSISEGKTMPMEFVFNGMGCEGKNISPDISWKNPPKGTKSFALTVYDPDAPTGSGWWHWTVFNIPADVTSIEKGASGGKMPDGSVEGRTDFGKSGYGGPCPPKGDKPHRYVFTIYALDQEKLDLSSDSPGAQVGFNVRKPLAEAKMTLKYGR